jgi:hypothetical protein
MSASTFRLERTPVSAVFEKAPKPVATGSVRLPSLTTTVPRELVHRASVAEVMLTGWERRDDSRFTVTGQWPRLHGFFTSVEGLHDPLIVAETVRQAGILLAHAEFGVPLDHHFLMWDLSIEVRPPHLVIGHVPASLGIDVACTDVKRRRQNLTGAHYEMVIRRDGQVAATARTTFTCTSPAVYQRLRGFPATGGARQPLPLRAPTAPHTVGRVSPTDVVLSPAEEANRWWLRADTRHPVLFDHPVDHVPGMVLLEAARQATAAYLDRPCVPLGVASEFKRYAELDAPCLIQACHAPGPVCGAPETVVVTGCQEGEMVFRSTVTVAPPTL